MNSTRQLAIVVVPPPANDPPPQGGNCAYSEPINPGVDPPTYHCYTQAEWDAKNAAVAQQQAANDKAFHEYWHNNYPVILGLLVVAIGLVTVVVIAWRRWSESYGGFYL